MQPRPAFLFVLTCLTLAALACNLSRSGRDATTVPHGEMTLEEALAIEPVDGRPEVLRLMGTPDSITITWQQLEGQTVRQEEWSYYDAQTRFDFVDGELVWTIDIDPVPDGSVFAHLYHPLDFEPTMTAEDIRSMLSDQTLVEESLAEADVPGGLALIGDQILLGFDKDHLTFVQTFVLSPGGESAAGLPADGEGAQPATGAASDSAPSVLLADDFEGSSPAEPLFGPEVMTFEEKSGEGMLTSFYPEGVVPIVFDQPLLSDFALEVDVRFPQAQVESAAGIIVRGANIAQGLTAYYHFVFAPGDKEVRLDLWKDGRWTTLATSPIPLGVLVPGAIDRLRVEADGAALRMFVNGAALLEANDGSLSAPGVIALSLTADQVPDRVSFDNLRIEALDE